MPEPLMKINRMRALLQCRDCFTCACVVQATLGPSGALFYLLGATPRRPAACGQLGLRANRAHSNNQAAARSNLIGSRPVTPCAEAFFCGTLLLDIFLLDILAPLRGAPA
jgi:hypothetical protein